LNADRQGVFELFEETIRESIRSVVREEIRAALHEVKSARVVRDDGKRLVTPAEAAFRYSISTSTITTYRRQGKLSRHHGGKVDLDELERVLGPKESGDGSLTDAELERRADQLLEQTR
jgi:hypothetical protein